MRCIRVSTVELSQNIFFYLFRNSRSVCLVLIQYGADVHLQDGDGDTPLMLAEGTDLKQAMMSKQNLIVTKKFF